MPTKRLQQGVVSTYFKAKIDAIATSAILTVRTRYIYNSAILMVDAIFLMRSESGYSSY